MMCHPRAPSYWPMLPLRREANVFCLVTVPLSAPPTVSLEHSPHRTLSSVTRPPRASTHQRRIRAPTAIGLCVTSSRAPSPGQSPFPPVTYAVNRRYDLCKVACNTVMSNANPQMPAADYMQAPSVEFGALATPRSPPRVDRGEAQRSGTEAGAPSITPPR